MRKTPLSMITPQMRDASRLAILLDPEGTKRRAWEARAVFDPNMTKQEFEDYWMLYIGYLVVMDADIGDDGMGEAQGSA